MLRRCGLLRARVTATTVERYLAHLEPTPGEEVVVLADVLPGPADPPHEVATFHAALVKRMRAGGNPPIGVKVVPTTAEPLRSLRAPLPLCSPIFRKGLLAPQPPPTVAAAAQRVTHLEATLALVLDGAPAGGTGDQLAEAVGGFHPALELLGSRFAFYAPHAPGFIADLGGHVGVALGAKQRLPPPPTGSSGGSSSMARQLETLAAHGLVLLRDGEPLQVGYPRNCMGSPLAALALAAEYAAKIGAPLERGSLVLLGGVAPRVAAARGSYEVTYGPLGSVTCLVEA